MKSNLYILLFLICQNIFAQNMGIDKKWLLGIGCCSGNYQTMELNFSSGALNISVVPRQMYFDETIGMISNSNNDILFYSNGVYIANALDDTMQNGSGLNPSAYTSSRNSYGLYLPQGNLVIPFPDDSMKYYLFHETLDITISATTLYLYYSIIDMTLNGGLGAVTQKNVVLINDSLNPGRLTACKHANGRDWWLFARKQNSTLMYKLLITPNGIQGPWIDDMITYRSVSPGQNLFSPDGTKYAYYETFDDLDIWDFDRCSGIFSNQIHIAINDSAQATGAAFSPSGRYLYLSSNSYIYQFDLQATNVDSSRITVGVYDGYTTNGFAANFFLMSLAPDGKIYTNAPNGVTVLHVINYPDSAGLACDFCQHCIPLPGYNNATMVNYPNYFLGADGSTVCDSLPTTIPTIKSATDDYLIFPNPASTDLYISITKEIIESVFVFNSYGQQVNIDYDIIKNEYLHFNVSELKSGVYYVSITSAGRKVQRKFVRRG